jgi:hypothetical protein
MTPKTTKGEEQSTHSLPFRRVGFCSRSDLVFRERRLTPTPARRQRGSANS